MPPAHAIELLAKEEQLAGAAVRSQYISQTSKLGPGDGAARSAAKIAARAKSSPVGRSIAEAMRPISKEGSRIGRTASKTNVKVNDSMAVAGKVGDGLILVGAGGGTLRGLFAAGGFMKIKTFEESALDSFGFLVSDFMFKVATVELQPPEVWVTFQKKGVSVTVIYEIGSNPWVRLRKVESSNGEPVSAWSSSLEKMLKEGAPGENLYLEPILSFDDPQIAFVLREKGRQLRKYAEVFLQSGLSSLGA